MTIKMNDGPMVFLHATVCVASLKREITITAFDDDDKKELYARLLGKFSNGEEAAILERLIDLAREKECSNSSYVKIAISPFGTEEISCSEYEITSIEDTCDKLAELGMLVLSKRKNDLVIGG